MERIRTVKKNNYTVVSNKILRNPKMSNKAKGFLIIVLSLPPEWDFSISGLRKIMPEGRDAIYSTINELISFGYCYREQTRDEKGKLGSSEYIFYEEPQQEKPYVVIPYTENPTQLNKESNKVKIEESKDRQGEKNFAAQILSPSLLQSYITHFFECNESQRDMDKLLLQRLPFSKDEILDTANKTIPIKYIAPLRQLGTCYDVILAVKAFWIDSQGKDFQEGQKENTAFMKGKHEFSFVVSTKTEYEEYSHFLTKLGEEYDLVSISAGKFLNDVSDALDWLERKKHLTKEDFGLFLWSWVNHSLKQGRYNGTDLEMGGTSIKKLWERTKAIYSNEA